MKLSSLLLYKIVKFAVRFINQLKNTAKYYLYKTPLGKTFVSQWGKLYKKVYF